MNKERSLTRALSNAADGRPGAAATFFSALLRSTVYLPKHPQGPAKHVRNATIIGKTSLSKLGYLTVTTDDFEVLPIFSELDFVGQWAGEELEAEAKELKSLLWVLGPHVMIHLNPGQEVGKELTPWEIEQLRLGEDAIPDLVAALDEDEGEDEILVYSSDPSFDSLKFKLRPILEIYDELREAFLVTVKESESSDAQPVVGLRYAGADPTKRQYIRRELEEAAREYLPSHLSLIVIDDLDSPQSIHLGFFSDATPFYLALGEHVEDARAGTSEEPDGSDGTDTDSE